ncbi:hypothetical protein [Pseudomonas putida]
MRLIGIALLGWFRSGAISEREREITESLKALKSLRCIHGCVSVDVQEVIGRPGYLEARRAAAALVRTKETLDWRLVEEAGFDSFLAMICVHLRESRLKGLSLIVAIERLKTRDRSQLLHLSTTSVKGGEQSDAR